MFQTKTATIVRIQNQVAEISKEAASTVSAEELDEIFHFDSTNEVEDIVDSFSWKIAENSAILGLIAAVFTFILRFLKNKFWPSDSDSNSQLATAGSQIMAATATIVNELGHAATSKSWKCSSKCGRTFETEFGLKVHKRSCTK